MLCLLMMGDQPPYFFRTTLLELFSLGERLYMTTTVPWPSRWFSLPILHNFVFLCLTSPFWLCRFFLRLWERAGNECLSCLAPGFGTLTHKFQVIRLPGRAYCKCIFFFQTYYNQSGEVEFNSVGPPQSKINLPQASFKLTSLGTLNAPIPSAIITWYCLTLYKIIFLHKLQHIPYMKFWALPFVWDVIHVWPVFVHNSLLFLLHMFVV